MVVPLEDVMSKPVKISDPVVYVDRYGVDRPALVTNVFDSGMPDKYPNPGINVVFVSPNEERKDQYGRQIEHETSVPHQSNQTAHGYKWRRIDEERKADSATGTA